MRSSGFRPLQTGCMYRPYRRPLFGASARSRSQRPLHVSVWADEAPKPGACLALDVFMADGSTLPTLADVAWVDPQPPGASARYRVGLSVFPPNDAGLRSLEQLVADSDAPPPSPPPEEGPDEERDDAAGVVVQVRGSDTEGARAPRGGDEAAAEEVPQ